MSTHLKTPPSSSATPSKGGPVVVVGYDGSPESDAALTIAGEHAGSEGTVVVVHATAAVPVWRGEPFAAHMAQSALHARGQIAADIARLDAGPATLEPKIVVADPVDALLEVAEAREAREIVVGSRGLGRVAAALGSVSHRLLEQADRPVTVVPPKKDRS